MEASLTLLRLVRARGKPESCYGLVGCWPTDAQIIPRAQVSLEEEFLNLRIFLFGETEPL